MKAKSCAYCCKPFGSRAKIVIRKIGIFRRSYLFHPSCLKAHQRIVKVGLYCLKHPEIGCQSHYGKSPVESCREALRASSVVDHNLA